MLRAMAVCAILAVALVAPEIAGEDDEDDVMVDDDEGSSSSSEDQGATTVDLSGEQEDKQHLRHRTARIDEEKLRRYIAPQHTHQDKAWPSSTHSTLQLPSHSPPCPPSPLGRTGRSIHVLDLY